MLSIVEKAFIATVLGHKVTLGKMLQHDVLIDLVTFSEQNK